MFNFMDIKGKVYCFFEQSGVFKAEFVKLGFFAEDYDIQNNYKQTDHVLDLFVEIEYAYDGKPSIFDNILSDDLIFAFFPCIHFCDAKVMMFKCTHISQKKWTLQKKMDTNIYFEQLRSKYFIILLKLVSVVSRLNLRLIIENPWNTSRMTFLQNNFPDPTIIDKDRSFRGDYFVKPTAYWFFNCSPTYLVTIQRNLHPRIVYREHGTKHKSGICDDKRSLISPDYARNFICDFILGKSQPFICRSLFD